MATAATSSSSGRAAQQADSYENIHSAYSFRSENAISETLREKIAGALGYSTEDTVHIPKDANIGEGCGNPLAIASLKEGETVIDLGSGGGFDCLLASKQVGTTGKVIGVDMTEGMIELARRNAIKMGATNTTFIQTRINNIPLPDNSVDCVMSNCVLNLVPDADKQSVMQEIHRILKPCGRIAISDYLALKPLPEKMKNDEVLRAGCVSGAVEVGVMSNWLFEIGFDDVLLVDTEKNLEIFNDEDGRKFVTPCCAGDSCGPITSSGRGEVDYDLREWISAFQIYGHKWCGKTEQHSPLVTAVSKTAGGGAQQQLLPQNHQQTKSSWGPEGCC